MLANCQRSKGARTNLKKDGKSVALHSRLRREPLPPVGDTVLGALDVPIVGNKDPKGEDGDGKFPSGLGLGVKASELPSAVTAPEGGTTSFVAL